jgi:hypothetical protein
MAKTFEEYYNDPEIADEPTALREIHAVRLQLHDERQGLTTAEYNSAVSESVDAFLAEYRKRRGLA